MLNDNFFYVVLDARRLAIKGKFDIFYIKDNIVTCFEREIIKIQWWRELGGYISFT